MTIFLILVAIALFAELVAATVVGVASVTATVVPDQISEHFIAVFYRPRREKTRTTKAFGAGLLGPITEGVRAEKQVRLNFLKAFSAAQSAAKKATNNVAAVNTAMDEYLSYQKWEYAQTIMSDRSMNKAYAKACNKLCSKHDRRVRRADTAQDRADRKMALLSNSIRQETDSKAFASAKACNERTSARLDKAAWEAGKTARDRVKKDKKDREAYHAEVKAAKAKAEAEAKAQAAFDRAMRIALRGVGKAYWELVDSGVPKSAAWAQTYGQVTVKVTAVKGDAA